ncbi:unnamed protein product [Leptosia nina]|uniref:SoHo domain-containing protein n=1 Tax=Leptosia nina TaxID=320188 RepID=A0AAV1JAQ7_9NEOP
MTVLVSAVWTPGAPPPQRAGESGPTSATPPVPPPPPIWTPSSATASPQTPRKTFRPVHFEESPPARRKFENTEQNGCTSGSESDSRLRTSHSAPLTGLNSLGASRLPKAQNPTVTLLQKAREGQLSRTISHQPQESDSRLPRDRPSPPFGDPIHALRRGYASEGEGERREQDSARKMADAQKKVEGIGPITKDGMPVTLRSEVKDPSRWYKKMYDTIHKNKYDNDYVTIRYKSRRDEPQRVSSSRSQYAYFDPRSGYLSEPEGGLSRLTSGTWSDAYDSDVTTGQRRRTASVQEERRNDVSSSYLSNNKYSTLASTRASQEVYKSQPGKIENYTPGKSSVVDKEAKQQNISSTTSLPPKEKRDITSTILSKSNMARALKESGYESDSTLVFKRREDTEAPLSPAERRAAYRDLQAGGEPPLRGFRSPAPPRTEESEIEYIPISATLTKIRVHKRSPSVHEVVCYPVTNIETNFYGKSVKHSRDAEMPPPPPRRISSRSSRTLQLMTCEKMKSTSPKRVSTNVDLMKEKITNKLNRQNTHVILKKPCSSTIINNQRRNTSTSAPPALNRYVSKNLPASTAKLKTDIGRKPVGTSSFSSPRKTIAPTEYAVPSRSKYRDGSSSVVIEGGVGRKTPITNILDKMTPLDKLWGSQKRNEQIDLTKLKYKQWDKNKTGQSKSTIIKPSASSSRPVLIGVPHKSRDMIRTSEKVQKLKSITHAQSTPCLSNKRDDRQSKNDMNTRANVSKSSYNICSNSKKSPNIKIAVVNNLKKKKSIETLVVKPKVGQTESSKNKTKYQKSLKGRNKNDECNVDKKDYVSEFHGQFGDDLRNNKLVGKTINCKEIKYTREAIISDSFFQHLFLKSAVSPNLAILDESNKSAVKEKTKFFQSNPNPDNYHTPNALNTYLIHRKPVSLSRFIMWDRNPSPLGIQNLRSISWPGRMDGNIKKFESLVQRGNEFGSTTSLSSVRSKSEPPSNKLYFSQTSRPKSPVVVFYKKNNDDRLKTISVYRPPPKIICNQSQSIPIGVGNSTISERNGLEIARSSSPIALKYNKQEHQFNDSIGNSEIPSTIYFSQTSRPVSPKVVRHNTSTTNRSHSTSPVSIRSPSYRRIYNVKSQHRPVVGALRPRSVDSSEKTPIIPPLISKSKSDLISQCNDPEYEEYISDIQNLKRRSERFRELNRYYSYLERVGELEKATSINDLHHRKRDEEIIDFDRWKKIRSIERAEEELNNLYEKLKTAQNEKDFLFYPRDVKDFRWNCDKERGLKIKEKSVEDLKDDFLQKSSCSHEVKQTRNKDTYKPLWRGTSVAETAFDINRKNKTDHSTMQTTVSKIISSQHRDLSLGDLRKKIGIGNRLWSSLSLDQVNALKNQLNAIYSKELDLKNKKDLDTFSVEVKAIDKNYNSNLHVRSNSLTTNHTNTSDVKKISKSDSIAAICPTPTEKDFKNNVNKIQMTLSENDKRRISQTISKEVIKRIKGDTKNTTDSLINRTDNDCTGDIPSVDNSRHIVYISDKDEPPSSASENDTGGSDVSHTTVIYVAPKREVQKKVEYFESVRNNASKSTVPCNTNEYDTQKSTIIGETANRQISQSQSCTDIKELFGESEKNKFLSLPSKPELYSRSPSPYSEVYLNDRRTPDTLRFSSEETIWRSRSPSPDPERYWRAYLKLARAGEVRRLARRFESPTVAGALLRRHRSDPEISCTELKNCLCTDRSTSHKERCKTSYTVARVPLRSTNRFMPHIDIISKLAALRRRTAPRSRSAEEALECRPGEVDRIRKRFEVMSLLGQIYSSAPDVSELKDIAPYLEGSWIAHRYPKVSDNNRSVIDPKTYVRGRLSPVKREVKIPVARDPLKLSSILKSDTMEGQKFDPSVHRPVSRYEPPRTPPRPPPAEWPYKLAPLVTPSRHTVTFQESDSAPEPPRRMQHGSISDSGKK